jgi:hypothetical protein
LTIADATLVLMSNSGRIMAMRARREPPPFRLVAVRRVQPLSPHLGE